MSRLSNISMATILLMALHFSTEKIMSSDNSEATVFALGDGIDPRLLITEEYYDFRPRPTLLPRYLQLGNQTVDFNTLFKVPPKDENDASDDNEDRSLKKVLAQSEITEKSVLGNTDEQRNNPLRHTLHNVKHKPSKELDQKGGTRSEQMPRFSRRHRYEQDERHGPHFDDMSFDNTSITVQAGHTVRIDCKVSLLRDKTVSWVRRKLGEPPVLLTVGDLTYTGDTRYSVQFRYPGNWRLQIAPVHKTDEGLYECQVSTHPPAVIRAHLIVEAPEVVIVDEFGSTLKEQYYEIGSTLQLRCLVRGAAVTTTSVWWLHGTKELHRDAERGGIAVKTDASQRSSGSMESILRVVRLGPADAGNYSCTLPPRTIYTVLVHVLSEESLGELQQGLGIRDPSALVYVVTPILAAILILVLVMAGVS